jgi:hypothetical protein
MFISFKTVLPTIRRRVLRQDKFGSGVETLSIIWWWSGEFQFMTKFPEFSWHAQKLLCKPANFKGVTSNETRLEECCINEVWK